MIYVLRVEGNAALRSIAVARIINSMLKMVNQDHSPKPSLPNPSTEQQSPSRQPPPLPPRPTSFAYLSPSFQPPPYSEAVYSSQPLTHSWASQDPRSSSTQSLVPAQPAPEKRTLLLVYIHGFLGNETSFKSFPAHVHKLVAVALAVSHVVHTKIYPRYKSRKAIEFARDDFSNWVCPHESDNTDVILLGHSMGGLLSAEVALLPPYSTVGNRKNRHRILGTINFDCPFLGIHPGVVASGIGSLFRPAPEFSPGLANNEMNVECSPLGLEQMPSAASEYFDSTNGHSTLGSQVPMNSGSTDIPQSLVLSRVSSQDPNYNPPFPNDIRRPVRTNWGSAVHFMTKHSDSLTKAARSYVTSHLEFGGCLADYKGLRNRYSRIRALEDARTERVRFVNYYTASTGRPKKQKESMHSSLVYRSKPSGSLEEPSSQELQNLSVSQRPSRSPMRSPRIPESGSRSRTRSPQISVEEVRDGVLIAKPVEDSEDAILVGSDSETTLLDAVVVSEEESENNLSFSGNQLAAEIPAAPAYAPPEPPDEGSPMEEKSIIDECLLLPPLPPLPTEPAQINPGAYVDEDTRELALKQHSLEKKAYFRALKDHAKALKDREKLVEKREKAAKRVIAKEAKLKGKESAQKLKKDEARRPSAASLSTSSNLGVAPENGYKCNSENSSTTTHANPEAEKPPRDKKFCLLPPKINSEVDPCWIRVAMRDLDEVGAHCGLFEFQAQYAWLVSDVGNRIKDWVKEM